MFLCAGAVILLWCNSYFVDGYLGSLYLQNLISIVNYKTKPIRIYIIFYFIQARIGLVPGPEL